MTRCYCLKYQLLCSDVNRTLIKCLDAQSAKCGPGICQYHFDRELSEEEVKKMHESAGNI